MTRPAVDKSKWGPGPWNDEPDFEEWLSPEGLTCQARRTSGGLGHWCGYIKLFRGHVWYSLPYEEINAGVEVHGDLTYANQEDDLWVIGFDCGHSFDYIPGMDHGTPSNYRTLAYVKAEVNSLAAQAAKAGGITMLLLAMEST